MPNCTEQKEWKVLYRHFSKSSSRGITLRRAIRSFRIFQHFVQGIERQIVCSLTGMTGMGIISSNVDHRIRQSARIKWLIMSDTPRALLSP